MRAGGAALDVNASRANGPLAGLSGETAALQLAVEAAATATAARAIRRTAGIASRSHAPASAAQNERK
jgi:hypothetical protein